MRFFKRLITPSEEEAFVDGRRELSQGDYQGALRHLQEATHLTDGAFLAGFLYLKNEDTAKAVPLLEQAARDCRQLGRYFDKYGLALTLSLPITEEIAAHVGPTLRGALLALVEAYQIAENWDKAYECLQRLRKLEPDDVAILLYKARALRGLSMNDAAKEILTAALRRKKDRSRDLMLTLRYERALTYDALGQAKRARSDFEKIYAEDPDFDDVAKRL